MSTIVPVEMPLDDELSLWPEVTLEAELEDTAVLVDPELAVEDVLRSVAWYSMRTPKALIPSALEKVYVCVLVIPFALIVMGREVVELTSGVHVQYNEAHTLDKVLVVTHQRNISLSRVGQHVTVVIDGLPRLL